MHFCSLDRISSLRISLWAIPVVTTTHVAVGEVGDYKKMTLSIVMQRNIWFVGCFRYITASFQQTTRTENGSRRKEDGETQEVSSVWLQKALVQSKSSQSNLAKAASNPWGNRNSSLTVFRGLPKSLYAKQDLDPFSRVCTAKPRDRQTDILNDAQDHRLQ